MCRLALVYFASGLKKGKGYRLFAQRGPAVSLKRRRFFNGLVSSFVKLSNTFSIKCEVSSYLWIDPKAELGQTCSSLGLSYVSLGA